MGLTLNKVKPRLNVLDDTFDDIIEDLIVASEELVRDMIHANVDLEDPQVQQVQQLWILGTFDERQTQYRNYINTQVSTLQMKYLLKEDKLAGSGDSGA